MSLLRARRVARHLIVPAMAALLLAGCASEEERFERHRAHAQAFLEAGKQKEAMIELRSALKLRPKDAETNFQIGAALEASRNLLDAIFFYREAVRLDPSHSEALLREAKLLLQDDTERAEELINALLEQLPGDLRTHVLRAELALVRADTEGAMAAALTAIELAPQDSRGHHQLGIVYQARIREARLLGETPAEELFEAAVAAFTTAKDHPGDVPNAAINAHVQLGRVYASWPGHGEQAGGVFRDAVKAAQDEGNPRTVASVGRSVLAFAKRTRNAELLKWVLRQIVDAQPGFLDGWYELAMVEDSEGRSGEGVFRELLGRRPSDMGAHVRFARYLADQGRMDEALAQLEEAAGVGVATPFVLAAKARLEWEAKRQDEARATVARMTRDYPDSPRTTIAVARMGLDDRRPAEVAAMLRELAASNESADVYRWLAEAEIRLRNWPEATDAVNRALPLASDPQRGPILQLKARTAYLAKDWPLVIQTYRKIAGSGAELNRLQRLHLAISLYHVGRSDAGRRILERLLALPRPPFGTELAFATHEGERSPERAYELLTDAHKRAPASAEILRELTRRDVKAGRAAFALQRLNQALEARQTSPQVLLIRARLLTRVGRLEAAERDALLAFEAAPNLPDAVDLLVTIYLAQDKLDEAVASFAEAEEAGLLRAGARALLGHLYLRVGEQARAEEIYEKALAERSDLASAKNDLAYLLASDGRDLDRALQLAQDAHEAMHQSPATADTLGYVYYRKGLHEAAVRQFRYALGLSSGQILPVYHYHLGLALRSLGQNEEAVEAFEAALRVDGDFSEAAEVRRQIEALRAQIESSAGSS